MRPALLAAMGMIIQIAVAILAGLVPVVGGIVIAAQLSVGLGSALLTALGTRVYTPAA